MNLHIKIEHNVLQLNIKRSWAAKNLLDQHMAENNFALAIISKSPQIKENGNWLISKDGLAAIHWNQELISCMLVEKGTDYIIIETMEIHIVVYYGSPNKKVGDFEGSLLRMQESLERHKNGRTLLAGNFNARSIIWGDKKTSKRGEILNDWTEHNDYRILNKGTTPTFSSDIGESIVDLTLASPGIMNHIKNWHVATHIETLSDHRAIVMQLNTQKIHSTSRTKTRLSNGI